MDKLTHLKSYVERQFQIANDLLEMQLAESEAIHELRLVLKRLHACTVLVDGCFEVTGLRRKIHELSEELGKERDKEVFERFCLDQKIKIKRSRNFANEKLHAPLRNVRKNVLNTQPQFYRAIEACDPIHLNWRMNLKLTFRSAAELFKRAGQTKKKKDFHSLRKKIKTLQHQIEALGLVSETTAQFMAKVKRLAGKLGDWHDFVVIERSLKKSKIKVRKELIRKIKDDRKANEKKILKSAEKILLKSNW